MGEQESAKEPIDIIDFAVPAISLFGVLNINIVIKSWIDLAWAWDINTAQGGNKAGTTTQQYVRALVGTITPKATVTASIGIEAAAGFDAIVASLKAAIGVQGKIELFNIVLPASMIVNVGRMRQLFYSGTSVKMTVPDFVPLVDYTGSSTSAGGNAFQKKYYDLIYHDTSGSVKRFLQITPTLVGIGLSFEAPC